MLPVQVTHSLLGVSKRILRAEGIEEEEEGPSRKEEEEEEEEKFNSDAPLFFYGVIGKEICEDDSPSSYNAVRTHAVLARREERRGAQCRADVLSLTHYLELTRRMFQVEATVIVSLIEKLLSAKEFQVNSNDIGVIAPYRLQVFAEPCCDVM